jgi:hypothetical protein
MRIGRSFDKKGEDETERAYARTSIAIGKYWLNKRVVPFLHEALEVLGGAGYVEESVMPRLYREAPVHGPPVHKPVFASKVAACIAQSSVFPSSKRHFPVP